MLGAAFHLASRCCHCACRSIGQEVTDIPVFVRDFTGPVTQLRVKKHAGMESVQLLDKIGDSNSQNKVCMRSCRCLHAFCTTSTMCFSFSHRAKARAKGLVLQACRAGYMTELARSTRARQARHVNACTSTSAPEHMEKVLDLITRASLACVVVLDPLSSCTITVRPVVFQLLACSTSMYVLAGVLVQHHQRVWPRHCKP